MKIEFKYWWIKREDDIHISECAIRFHEGEVTTEDEPDSTDPENIKLKKVTRFRRSKRLQSIDLPQYANRKKTKELTGDDCIVFTTEDFGIITEDQELSKFLKTELKKDSRTPIDEQIDNEDEQ